MAYEPPLPGHDYTETEVSTRSVFRGRLLDVREDHIRLPDGKPAQREYIVHPGAVAIIALVEPDSLILEYQFRYPGHRHFWELPAGKLEPGEPELAAAQRELLEETGYGGGEWLHVTTLHTAIAYTNERIEVFLARDLEFRGRHLDEGEFLDVRVVPIGQALAWVDEGYITDVKTVSGLLWLARHGAAGMRASPHGPGA